MATKIITEIYLEDNYAYSDRNIEKQQIQAISWSKWFDTWLNALDDELPQASSYELSLRLCGDREIAVFNQQYRQKDRPTDVLAFAALESELILPQEFAESLYLGDIVISLDRANEQAVEQQHSLATELAWLASHGLLHLLGWDHQDDSSLFKMLKKQANLLKLIEITE